jgi:adenylate cyclase
LGLTIAAVGIVLAATSPGWALEENFGLAWLFKTRGPIDAPPEVIVVGIDRESSRELGLDSDTSKWPRSTHARLIDNLVRHGASVIVLDLTFTESRSLDEDGALAVAIARAKRVALLEHIRRETVPILMDRLVSPMPQFSDAAMGLGPFPLEKVDAYVNQFWAFKDVGGEVPTLPVVALQIHALQVFEDFVALLKQAGFRRLDRLPQSPSDLRNAEDVRELMSLLRLEFRENPQMSIRLLNILQADPGLTDRERRLLTALVKLYAGADSHYLNFYGPPATIRRIPYDDALGDPDVAGKVVFVGASELASAEQEDDFSTVFGREDGVDLSGSEIAATVFGNLLTDGTIQRRLELHLSTLLLFGVLVGILAYLLPGLRAVAAVAVVGALYYFGIGQWLFSGYDLWVPVFIPLVVQLPMALFLGLFSQYLTAKREEERLRTWVPKKVLYVPEAGPAFGTCLLTDIQGSRVLSSQLSDPEYNSLMESYYDKIVPPVVRNSGRVWDFSGDGMMCLFAAKQPEKSLRQSACLAALEILEEVDLFNQLQDEKRRVPTRIGLHAGWMELGGKTLGDVGNTVASIEGLSKRLSTRILASQAVADDLSRFLLRRLGSFILRGKTEPLTLFEVMSLRKSTSESDHRLCEQFAVALREFETQSWSEAAKIYESILLTHPKDGPSQFYLQLCRKYCTDEPPSGDDPCVIRIH